MKPVCAYHPCEQAKYYCNSCGLMCKIEDEPYKDHQVMVLTQNQTQLIGMLMEESSLKGTIKHHQRMQKHIIEVMQKQATEMKKAHKIISERIGKSKDMSGAIPFDQLRKCIGKPAKGANAGIVESNAQLSKDVQSMITQANAKWDMEIMEDKKFNDLCKKYPINDKISENVNRNGDSKIQAKPGRI